MSNTGLAILTNPSATLRGAFRVTRLIFSKASLAPEACKLRKAGLDFIRCDKPMQTTKFHLDG
jgi:hypothetical protein